METSLTTREATRQVRLRQWQEIFHDRRESGMTVKDYCESHGITKDSYYYWQKVSREAAIAAGGVVFAELMPEPESGQNEFRAALTIQIGSAVVSADDNTSAGLLQRAIWAVNHAE